MRDVVVHAPTGTPLSGVRRQLFPALDPDVTLSVESVRLASSRPLPDDHPLGMAPLLDGCTLLPQSLAGAPAPPVLQLRVVSGVDAGTILPLTPGRHLLGRGSGCALVLADPEVSRIHVELVVSTDGVHVRKVSETNQACLSGTALTGEPSAFRLGSRLELGRSVLQLAVATATPAAVTGDGQGGLSLNRPPRARHRPEQRRLRFPEPPGVGDKPRLPLITVAVPLLAGAALLAFGGGRPGYLVLVALSPVMAVGAFLGERSTRARRTARELAAYGRRTKFLQAELATALAADLARRRADNPDAASVLDMVALPDTSVWRRNPHDDDFLHMRVATGPVASDVEVQRSADDTAYELRQLHENAPVVVDLARHGVIGVSGPRDTLLASACWLVGQVLALHSPLHVELAVLTAAPDGAAAWQWLRWAPHRQAVAAGLAACTAQAAGLVSVLDDRAQPRTRSSGEWPGPFTVVVLDGARALRSLPAVSRLLVEGPAVGIFTLCLETASSALPRECAATVNHSGSADVSVQRHGERPVSATAELVTPSWRETLARCLAPLRDATPVADLSLPTEARLLDLLEPGTTCAESLAERWRTRGASTVATLGVADGPFTVNLKTDGPHMLIAGTTGAGKSELLQTLIASLAAANRPDDLNFVLVDYKGGAAFAQCSALPHVVGMVTDLDTTLTERALTSLSAELRRRERLLRRAEAHDIDSYLDHAGTGGGEREPMPRLVLIIDEFATLVDELPGFVDGLVGIAQRGRSLGIHLVLATQRPAGVVSANVRANVNLRVALRMADTAESADVIDVPDAAFISRHVPGRAVARSGTGSVVAFQTARVTGQAARESATTVTPLDAQLPSERGQEPATSTEPNDLARLVVAANDAMRLLGVAAPRRPWLAPLPERLSMSSLAPAPTDALAYGLVDRPAEQTQETVALDLAAGRNLLVAGGARTGRSTMLRTLAAAAATAGNVHVYAFDPGSVLGSLTAVPSCGAVIGRDEVWRGQRLIHRLTEQVAARRSWFARHGVAGVVEQRAMCPDDPMPWLLLLVDSWESFLATYDPVANGAVVEELLRLLREGPAVGMTTCVTGDRSSLTGRVGALMAERVVLRFADPADATLAGIPLRAIPTLQPPGRGLVPTTCQALQIALPDDGSPSGQQVQDRAGRYGVPLHVRALPDRVVASELGAPDPARPRLVSLGRGGDDGSVLAVDLAEDGPALLICGPPGSGRSTALLALAEQLKGRGSPVIAVASRRSPLRALRTTAHRCVIGFGDADELRAALDGRPSCLVLVDDAEQTLDTAVEPLLLELVRDDGPYAESVGVVLAGATAELAAGYRGVGAAARKARSGVVLGATGSHEDGLLGVRVGAVDDPRPGRGFLVQGTQVQPIQLATTSD